MTKKVLVTGASGFLGRHIVPVLERRYGDVACVSSADFDLTRESEVAAMFGQYRPEIVVHLAAYVGGILANKMYPADFFYRNITMTTLVPHYAYRAGVKKFVTFMGGCSYPASAKSPISEEQMWDGYPQFESAAYSAAKKMALVQAEAYRRQYGFDFVVLIPGNVYGEYDNFHLENSHVIPAMIRKFHEARANGERQVTLWGSGRPQRDFVYAADVAAVIPWFLESYSSPEPVNISSGTTTAIRELAETVSELVGYEGQVVWDSGKPDGQLVKIFDVSRLKSLGLSCDTPLWTGLEKTVGWFAENYAREEVRL
jgi:GDP-L-fucose synthase